MRNFPIDPTNVGQVGPAYANAANAMATNDLAEAVREVGSLIGTRLHELTQAVISHG